MLVMWRLVFCLMMHNIYFVNGEENTIIFNTNDAEVQVFDHISECIKTVSDLILNFSPTVVIDVQHIEDKPKGNMFIDEMVKRLTENNTPIVIIADVRDSNLLDSLFIIEDKAFEKKYNMDGLIVTYFETCDEVSLNFLNKINKDVKHLILINESMKTCTPELDIVKDTLGQYDITFILIDDTKYRHEIFTYIPKIDKEACTEIVDQITHINTCVNGTLTSNEVFPSKNPSNLNKCPFRVGMATLYPFSEIKGKESLQTYDRVNESVGSDMALMQIIAEHINASLDLHYIYRKEENPFGDYEFLKFVLNGTLDVCAGGLYRIYGDVVAYSGIYTRQAVIWIYYGERSERSWENLISKVGGLYIFIIFYIIYSIIWYFICVFDGHAVCLRNTLLYGWGALVGANSLQDARSTKQKILNLGYLIMSIHLSAYISVQLYSFLTIRGPPQTFRTNDDVMDSGRVPYLKTSTKYFVDDRKYQNFANTSAECVSFLDCAEKTLAHNGLTVVLQGNFYHFQSATAVNGEARILRATENLLTVYNEMVIRKDSPLVSKFRQLTQSLFEAGITERLFYEAIGILVMAKAESANSNILMNSYSCQAGCTITFMQFAGVFYAWIFGCVLSFIVFVVEIVTKREKKKIYVN